MCNEDDPAAQRAPSRPEPFATLFALNPLTAGTLNPTPSAAAAAALLDVRRMRERPAELTGTLAALQGLPGRVEQYTELHQQLAATSPKTSPPVSRRCGSSPTPSSPAKVSAGPASTSSPNVTGPPQHPYPNRTGWPALDPARTAAKEPARRSQPRRSRRPGRPTWASRRGQPG